MLSDRERIQRALLAGGIGCLAGVFYLMTPESIPSLSCAFRELTGHSCFTCGLTRSLLAIAHGQLTDSLRYHLMGPVVFLGALIAMITLGAEAWTGRKWSPRIQAGFWKHALVFLLLLWITYGGIRLALEIAG
jgi:formate/nitrite transporter FocA (FNT family)